MTRTELPGVMIVEPQIFGDARGSFLETFSARRYAEAGIPGPFVQDNISFSTKGVLRGLHFQHPHPQGKLLEVLAGEVFDVAVDMRMGSPTFGRWAGMRLSAANHRQVYVPPGFAHGFLVLSEQAIFSYKCTEYYSPSEEGGIIWNDPDLAIAWPASEPILSSKDAAYPRLKDVPAGRLPEYRGGQ